MQRDPRSFLWDVQEAGEAIRRFVAGLDADSYASSELVRSAVERKFAIIGEALNQLSKSDATLAARVPHLAEIVAFRNLLIHGYAAVNHTTVWDTIKDSLPELLAAVEALLAGESAKP
jgi:uncharacterized protein with HEPN domain